LISWRPGPWFVLEMRAQVVLCDGATLADPFTGRPEPTPVIEQEFATVAGRLPALGAICDAAKIMMVR
jgi:hypothetical protein